MLETLKTSKTSRQTFFLFFAQIFGLVINFLSGMLVAKGMGSVQYGIYSLALSIITFLSIFFEFGYFASISRLLAQCKDEICEKELLGASLVVLIVISILFVLTVLILSFLVDIIFKDKVGKILFITSFFSFAYVIPFFMELVLKGSNHIEQLAIFNLLYRIVYMMVVIYLFFYKLMNPTNIILISFLSCIMSFAYITYILHPSFKNFKFYWLLIKHQNKIYGLHVYTGRVIDVATYQLDRILLGYFIDAKSVGLYSIANSMANPINTFSTSLASTKFKDFANENYISHKIIKINFFWILFAIACVNLIGYIVIFYFLGEAFHESFLLLLIMTLAVGFQAAYQPYNAWLCANGFGDEMKKLNYKMALITLITAFVLIYLFHTVGAAVASVLSNIYSLYLYIRLYYEKSSV